MAAYISFQPSDYFSTKLYTGNGSTQSVTGVGFQPDLVWIKNRDATDNHCVADAARGDQGASYKYLYPDGNYEQSAADAAFLTSLDADGFSVGDSDRNNANTEDLVSWNWKMGTTSGISGGTITPTAYSISTTAGQSVIAYSGNGTSGATIPHGLGVTPDLVICKRLDSTGNWWVNMESFTGAQCLVLNNTGAIQNATPIWNETRPTSTVFTVGNDNEVNNSSGTYIAYCFAPKKGYSKFGTYTGNGNADGPFIYTGFRPAFVLIKNSGGVEAWNLWDNKRSTSGSNLTNMNLQPNTATAENTATAPGGQVIDILSNGFKIRGTTTETNQSTKTMIYWAFAEFPFVSSNSKAGTAR